MKSFASLTNEAKPPSFLLFSHFHWFIIIFGVRPSIFRRRGGENHLKRRSFSPTRAASCDLPGLSVRSSYWHFKSPSHPNPWLRRRLNKVEKVFINNALSVFVQRTPQPRKSGNGVARGKKLQRWFSGEGAGRTSAFEMVSLPLPRRKTGQTPNIMMNLFISSSAAVAPQLRASSFLHEPARAASLKKALAYASA